MWRCLSYFPFESGKEVELKDLQMCHTFEVWHFLNSFPSSTWEGEAKTFEKGGRGDFWILHYAENDKFSIAAIAVIRLPIWCFPDKGEWMRYSFVGVSAVNSVLKSILNFISFAK